MVHGLSIGNEAWRREQQDESNDQASDGKLDRADLKKSMTAQVKPAKRQERRDRRDKGLGGGHEDKSLKG